MEIDKRDNRIYEIQRDAYMPEITDSNLKRLTDKQVDELYKIHWDMKTTFDSTKKEELINRANQILENAGKNQMFSKAPPATAKETSSAISAGGASFNPFDFFTKFTSGLSGITGPLLSTLFQFSPLLLFGRNYSTLYNPFSVSMLPYPQIPPIITPPPPVVFFPTPSVPPAPPNLPNLGA